VLETRLDIARIRAIRRVVDPVFLNTPLYRCEALEPGLGYTVSIKLETANLVRSKARGTEVFASLLAGNGSQAVVCASAGNLGQALAWSGRGRGSTAPWWHPALRLRPSLIASAPWTPGWSWWTATSTWLTSGRRPLARHDGIRLVEDSLDIETCEGAATSAWNYAERAVLRAPGPTQPPPVSAGPAPHKVRW